MGNASSSTKKNGYENGKPTFGGGKVVKIFKERGNGLLFRIVNGFTKKWAFYNDTLDYDMNVEVTFNSDCDIKPLGNTQLETLENGDVVARVVVRPTETEKFIVGRVNGFKVKATARRVGTVVDGNVANANHNDQLFEEVVAEDGPDTHNQGAMGQQQAPPQGQLAN